MLNSYTVASLFLIYVRITMKYEVISLQLPALLIGHIETLILGIGSFSCRWIPDSCGKRPLETLLHEKNYLMDV